MKNDGKDWQLGKISISFKVGGPNPYPTFVALKKKGQHNSQILP